MHFNIFTAKFNFIHSFIFVYKQKKLIRIKDNNYNLDLNLFAQFRSESDKDCFQFGQYKIFKQEMIKKLVLKSEVFL